MFFVDASQWAAKGEGIAYSRAPLKEFYDCAVLPFNGLERLGKLISTACGTTATRIAF